MPTLHFYSDVNFDNMQREHAISILVTARFATVDRIKRTITLPVSSLSSEVEQLARANGGDIVR